MNYKQMSHTRPTDCELSLHQGSAFSSNTQSDLIIAVEKKTAKTQRIYFWFRPAMQEFALVFVFKFVFHLLCSGIDFFNKTSQNKKYFILFFNSFFYFVSLQINIVFVLSRL